MVFMGGDNAQWNCSQTDCSQEISGSNQSIVLDIQWILTTLFSVQPLRGESSCNGSTNRNEMTSRIHRK